MTSAFDDCTWLNAPADWRRANDTLVVKTDEKTDFWRRTHYGFTRHSGHVYGKSVAGDFTAEIRVCAQFRDLYDQAGLMILVDETRWVKAGIEFANGQAQLSSVLTNDTSDWATGAYGGDAGDFRIRMIVSAGVLKIHASADGINWPLMRLCPFPSAKSYFVGAMCCSPERQGLDVVFSSFAIYPPLAKATHDLF